MKREVDWGQKPQTPSSPPDRCREGEGISIAPVRARPGRATGLSAEFPSPQRCGCLGLTLCGASEAPSASLAFAVLHLPRREGRRLYRWGLLVAQGPVRSFLVPPCPASRKRSKVRFSGPLTLRSLAPAGSPGLGWWGDRFYPEEAGERMRRVQPHVGKEVPVYPTGRPGSRACAAAGPVHPQSRGPGLAAGCTGVNSTLLAQRVGDPSSLSPRPMVLSAPRLG